jgi:Raf kinase inhibitor-like YbhB/YbcL family protein
MMRVIIRRAAIVALCTLSACAREHQAGQGSGADTTASGTTPAKKPRTATTPKLVVTSSAFADGATIPKEFTCDGRNVSPPLNWGDVPAEAKSIALLCEDPDAPGGIWTHWTVWSIPAGSDKKTLAGLGIGAGASGGEGYQGRNDFGKPGYGGPCPPGGTHHYIFKVYALDTILKPSGDGSRKELLAAMEGHILAEGELVGMYGR